MGIPNGRKRTKPPTMEGEGLKVDTRKLPEVSEPSTMVGGSVKLASLNDKNAGNRPPWMEKVE